MIALRTWYTFVCSLFSWQVIDAGDAVRAQLREHEQALLEEEATSAERANHKELQVRVRPRPLPRLTSTSGFVAPLPSQGAFARCS